MPRCQESTPRCQSPRHPNPHPAAQVSGVRCRHLGAQVSGVSHPGVRSRHLGAQVSTPRCHWQVSVTQVPRCRHLGAQVSGVNTQVSVTLVSGAQVSGAQVSGVRCQVSTPRCPAVRCQHPGVSIPGVRCRHPGDTQVSVTQVPRCQVSVTQPGVNTWTASNYHIWYGP